MKNVRFSKGIPTKSSFRLRHISRRNYRPYHLMLLMHSTFPAAEKCLPVSNNTLALQKMPFSYMEQPSLIK